ncbi:hypothetical protein DR64_3974 [Paraburkholderia xenovorans LB400]|nr:hypothetical protein DR64_3974 [Paraburkholderia xenovorans LB400]
MARVVTSVARVSCSGFAMRYNCVAHTMSGAMFHDVPANQSLVRTVEGSAFEKFTVREIQPVDNVRVETFR